MIDFALALYFSELFFELMLQSGTAEAVDVLGTLSFDEDKWLERHGLSVASDGQTETLADVEPLREKKGRSWTC